MLATAVSDRGYSPLAQFCAPHKYFSLEYDETLSALLSFMGARVCVAGGAAADLG
jgi:hypothetical protein